MTQTIERAATAPAPVPESTRVTLTWRWAAVLVVLGVVAACWRAVLDPDRALGDPYDFIRQFLPDRAFQVDAIRALALPSWNPLDAMGVPYIASFQPAFFSPSTWTLAGTLAVLGAEPTPRIMSAWQVAHAAFAGLGVLMCARLLRLSPWAGVAGGLCFGLSGFLLGQAGHVNQQNTAAWLPWSGAALFWLWREPGRRRLAVAAAAVGALVLAGHPQIAAYSLAALAAGAGWMMIRRPRSAPWLAGAFAGGAALAAVQVLPLLQYTRVAVRGAQGYDYATTYSTPLAHLFLFVAPHALGDSAATYRGTPSLGEYAGYVGLLPLLLIPAALAGRRRGLAIALIAATCVAMLFALGRNGPLFPVIYPVVAPLLERFRNPGRAVLVVDFALALLAALGVDRLRRSGRAVLLAPVAVAAAVLGVLLVLRRLDAAAPHRRGVALAIVLLLATAGALMSRRPAVVALVLLVDLAVSSGSAFLVTPPRPLYRDAAAAAFVRNVEGLAPGDLPAFRVESDSATLGLEQDNGAVVGVAKTMGDDSLVFAPYVDLRRQLGFMNAQGVQLGLFGTDELASPLIDMIGARYLLSERSPGLLTQVARAKFEPLQSVDGVWVYRNPDALPMVWVVGGVVAPSGPAAVERIDGRAVAATEEPGPLNGPGPAGTADITGQGLSWVRIDATVAGPRGGVLVTGFLDYPGWQLTVDGRPAASLRVNHAFRGAWLPPGEHTVVWRFVNRPLRLGLTVSGAALAVLVALALIPSRR